MFGLFDARFVHENIIDSSPIRNEASAGWIFHYLTGGSLALTYPLFYVALTMPHATRLSHFWCRVGSGNNTSAVVHSLSWIWLGPLWAQSAKERQPLSRHSGRAHVVWAWIGNRSKRLGGMSRANFLRSSPCLPIRALRRLATARQPGIAVDQNSDSQDPIAAVSADLQHRRETDRGLGACSRRRDGPSDPTQPRSTAGSGVRSATAPREVLPVGRIAPTPIGVLDPVFLRFLLDKCPRSSGR